MPAAKRRRTDAAPPATRITAFTRVSKAHAATKEVRDKTAKVEASLPDAPSIGEKRKARSLLDDDDDDDDDDGDATTASAILSAAAAYRPGQEPPTTPQKQRLVDYAFIERKTPTKGARILLERCFDGVESRTRLSTSAKKANTKLSQASKESLDGVSAAVPDELVDLVALNMALLSTLSIHFAHHGVHTPVDLRSFYPSVSRLWGKRAVKSIDVRRCLGVQNRLAEDKKLSTLRLVDYGHGKVCIELTPEAADAGMDGTTIRPPLNEEALNSVFAANLVELWRQRDQTADTAAFIAALPQRDIVVCDALHKLSPLLAKGAARLAELKSPRPPRTITSTLPATADDDDDAATPPDTPTPTRFRTVAASAHSSPRGPTLLERLRAKAQQAAAAPPPPTPAARARTAALHRLADVVPMVSVLSTASSRGQTRVSFTLATVVQALVASARAPLAAAEADRCVRALADEVAPEWLRLVALRPAARAGRAKSAAAPPAHEMVVVEREKFPGLDVIRQRVATLLSEP